VIRALLIAIAWSAACSAAPRVKPPSDPTGDDDKTPFVDTAKFKPRSFVAEVTGDGRPVIFIPGLGCPGEMWQPTVDHLGDRVQAHVLTLAGFAGQPRIDGPLAATARRELARYIKANKLHAPIIIGHSMGGFIAYWLAATAPDLIGGVIVVDAGPALADTDVMTARALRNMWAQAGDDELPEQVRVAYTSMTTDPRHIAPYLAAIAKSDRKAIGDAIYELVTTDLRDRMTAITAPLLLVLADGSYQKLYRSQVEAVPDHQIVVVPRTRHFVFFDDPDGFYRVVDKFLAAHPEE
jgi:pimeloyl-ACP methyl ester carboxylesterase